MEYKVRFCDQCGAKLEEGAKFCTNCGSRITEADPTPAPQNIARPEPQRPAEPAPLPEEHGHGQIERPSFMYGAMPQGAPAAGAEEEIEYIEPMPQFKHVDVEPAAVAEPEPVAAPEPEYIEPEPVAEAEPEYIEPEQEPEVEYVEPEPVVEPEPIAEPEPEYIEPEPVAEPEPASEPEPEYIEPEPAVMAAAPVFEGDPDEDATVALSEEKAESAEQIFARLAKPANLHKIRSGEYVNIDKPEFIVGKNPLRTDFAIRDNNTVSRVHASIRWTEDGYSIADLGSMNGTFVNGVPVGEEGHMLYDGDVITLSDEEFKFSIIEI